MIRTEMLILLYFLVFLAGFIDSIAGGGGLISLPAYIFVGLPAHNAIATNKFTSSLGTTLSTLRFLKNKALDLKISLISSVGSFMAAHAASELVLKIDEKIFRAIIMFTLPVVAIVILSRRNFGNENLSDTIEKRKAYIYAFFIGLFIGFYDGLIGPGTGTFAIMAYCLIMKYDLKTASGNSKMLNLASNYASLSVFLFSGKIGFSIALPAVILGLLGNYIGSGFAIKKGAKFIRPTMIVVIVLLFAKIFLDVFGGFLKL
ncbi:hypothetical protein HMPREF0379_1831 [[Eubacterium] yurii subsp. margaretiae ATCC 43715]|nr:hypothetical protein HMPREF0379_1831 [[Eubacterium] yurii subsp. margaretiae ATCC 43715]